MRKIFLALALVASSAFGAIPDANFEFLVNRLPGQPLARKYSLGTMVREGYARATCVYDFSARGGAVGTINLYQTDGLTPCTLPNKAIILDGLIDVITNPTSGGSATIAVGANTTTDLKGATAIASFTGRLDVVPVGSAATSVKLTAARTLTMTVATAALTAGKFRVFVDYMLSE